MKRPHAWPSPPESEREEEIMQLRAMWNKTEYDPITNKLLRDLALVLSIPLVIVIVAAVEYFS